MNAPRRVSTLPRYVRPENVMIGDLIRVTLPENKGIVVTRTGRVAVRDYVGDTRVLSTAERAILLEWHPAHKPPTVTLLEAAPMGESMLPGLDRL